MLFIMMYLMPEWSQGNMLMRMLRLMGVVIAGAGAYFAALYALGFRLRTLHSAAYKLFLSYSDGADNKPCGIADAGAFVCCTNTLFLMLN